MKKFKENFRYTKFPLLFCTQIKAQFRLPWLVKDEIWSQLESKVLQTFAQKYWQISSLAPILEFKIFLLSRIDAPTLIIDDDRVLGLARYVRYLVRGFFGDFSVARYLERPVFLVIASICRRW